MSYLIFIKHFIQAYVSIIESCNPVGTSPNNLSCNSDNFGAFLNSPNLPFILTFVISFLTA